MRFFWVVALAVAVLAFPIDSFASPACSGPWGPATSAPVGCPLTMVDRDGLPPTVEVWRNGERVDVTANVVSTNISLDVEYFDVVCFQAETTHVQSEQFVHHQIELTGTQAGDEVVMDGSTVLLGEAAACPVMALPMPECNGARMPCEDPEPEGTDDIHIDHFACSARSGSASLPLALALALGAAVRRRRRRRQ